MYLQVINQLIKQLKQRNPELNQFEIEKIIEVICKSLEEAFIAGKKVEIRGFGTFFVKKIKENHSARNPRTGELIYVPERNKVRFRASKKLKEFINK